MPTIFIALFCAYFAGNIYIFIRGAQTLVAQPFGVKVLLTVLFWSCALAFVVSMLARNVKYPDVMAHTIHEVGIGLAGFYFDIWYYSWLRSIYSNFSQGVLNMGFTSRSY